MTIDFCSLSECEFLSLAAVLSAKLTDGASDDEVAFLGDLFTLIGSNIIAIAGKRSLCSSIETSAKQKSQQQDTNSKNADNKKEKEDTAS